jgi:excisionase family DNA binding protein
VNRRSRTEPYLTAQQVGKRLGVAWPALLREYGWAWFRVGGCVTARSASAGARSSTRGTAGGGCRSRTMPHESRDARTGGGGARGAGDRDARRAGAGWDELGSATIDRLADLVANRLAERRAAGELPLLTVRQAAEIAGLHPDTLRRAIHSGALEVAGYAGSRPRLRREDLERWLRDPPPRSSGARSVPAARVQPPRRVGRPDRRRVLGEALEAPAGEGRS